LVAPAVKKKHSDVTAKVHSKRMTPFTEQHSVITQKIGILSNTAVKTPNLARLFHCDVSVSDLMTISCPSQVFGSLNEYFRK